MPLPPVAATSTTATPSVLDIIDKVVKILAVLIGGAWAYLNYRRGRTFKKRLELTICGNTISRNGVLLLSGSAQLKNVGLSKVPIQQKGTAILISDLRAGSSLAEPTEAAEELALVREVFKDHGWIEPGETIEDSFLLQLPANEERIGLKLGLRIVAAHIEWNANAIVELGNANPSTAKPTVGAENCGTQSTAASKEGSDTAIAVPEPTA